MGTYLVHIWYVDGTWIRPQTGKRRYHETHSKHESWWKTVSTQSLNTNPMVTVWFDLGDMSRKICMLISLSRLPCSFSRTCFQSVFVFLNILAKGRIGKVMSFCSMLFARTNISCPNITLYTAVRVGPCWVWARPKHEPSPCGNETTYHNLRHFDIGRACLHFFSCWFIPIII